MIELLLLASLATADPSLSEVEASINQSIEKPEHHTELEVIIDRFGTYCDNFYGCGINYPGAMW